MKAWNVPKRGDWTTVRELTFRQTYPIFDEKTTKNNNNKTTKHNTFQRSFESTQYPNTTRLTLLYTFNILDVLKEIIAHWSILRLVTDEPRRQKTGLRGFWPGPTQTRLCSHRKWLEAWNFVFRKKRDCVIRVAKTKALISFAVTAKLICVFVFVFAKIRFSHVAAQMVLDLYQLIACLWSPL